MSSSKLHAQSDASNRWVQESFLKIGVGATLGITSKTSSYNYALGIDLNAQHKLSEEITIVATGGYRRLLTKDTSPVSDFDFISSFAGIKIFPVTQLFIEGAVGIGFPLQKDYRQGFIFYSGLGFPLNPEIDLSVRYEGYRLGLYTLANKQFNGQFALRFVYNFQL